MKNRIAGTAYRAHDPKWAFEPTSVAGAILNAGRFNRIGVAALYLSMRPETALNEYASTDGGETVDSANFKVISTMSVPFVRERQFAATDSRQLNQWLAPATALMSHQRCGRLIRPVTLCSYNFDCADIADLRTKANCAVWNIRPADIEADWRKSLINCEEPPSWNVARRLIAKGCAGALVPSFAPGATSADVNLVLWKWADQLPHQVIVFDPDDQLPKTQASWPSRNV